MTSSLLAFYLQCNLLVASAWLVWVTTKAITRALKIEASQRGQLQVARFLFTGLLLILSCVLISSIFSIGWLAGIIVRADEYWFVPGMPIVAGLDDGLGRQYLLGGIQVNIALLFSLVLLAGFAWQTYTLAIAVRCLKQIVSAATEWKNLHGVQLVFSQQIATPFSTLALGRKQIVLPYTLLASPRNLRLAVAHELQHLRNGDLGWVILLEGIKRLCFWNPAVHLWQYEFDCLQELACDEALVQDKQVNALAYGNCLLDVASNNTGHTLVAVSSMVPKLSLLHNSQSQLKRRILMLGKKGGNKYTSFKLAGYGFMLGAGLLNATLVVFAADQGAGRADYIPVSRVNPQYPASALEKKQVGWVQVEFAIDTNGGVQDAVVLGNCVRLQTAATESCTQDPLFDAETLAALRQWRYEPVMENGVAVRVEGVQMIMRYELGDEEAAAAQQ
jgi:TonB family protein